MSNLKKSFIGLLWLWVFLPFFSCKAQDPQLKVGDVAPDFKLMGDDGKVVQLSSLKGKTVVLYFYPKDQTPGCTKEACGMRDNLGAIQAENTLVFGISVDKVSSHQNFKEKQKLNFTLLSDSTKVVSKQYSGLNIFGMSNRVTYIIDKNGVIQKIYPKVDVGQHAEDVLAFIRTLK